jgi:hypothetical protein
VSSLSSRFSELPDRSHLAIKIDQEFDPDQIAGQARSGAVGQTTVGTVKGELKGLPGFSVSSSARTIVELNIGHFRQLLKTETDPAKRQVITKLLAEEEATLARLTSSEKEE